MRTPGPRLIQGRAKALGGGGKGWPPPPNPVLPSPTPPDGRLPGLQPVLTPCGPPRPARLGEGAGALSWAGFPLPRLCLCPPPFRFHLPLLLSSLLPLHLLLPPLLSPLLSSIFSFPLPPCPGPPSLLPPVLPPCSRGAPFWTSWGPLSVAGEGALWTALSPRPSHTTTQRQSISPLSFSGLEGAQPSVPPGSVASGGRGSCVPMRRGGRCRLSCCCC